MAKGNVCLILAADKSVGGVKKKRGTVILEGVCLNGATLSDIGKAIQLREVEIESRESEEAANDV